MAERQNRLPQEGTVKRGESLPEHSRASEAGQCSGRPSDSGGGDFRLKTSTTGSSTKPKENHKTYIQQVFHESLFTSRQSASSPSNLLQTEEKMDECSELDQPHIGDSVNTCENIQQEDWTEIPNKKRLRPSPETSSKSKQSKLSSYWLSQTIETSNRFTELEVDQETPAKETREPRPPPIFVDKVANIQPLIKLLNAHVSDEYTLKVLQSDKVKIQPHTSQTYPKIVKLLEEKDTEFYTYKPKSERSFKVVLKNIHPTMDTDEIKIQLHEQGHIVTNIWNIKQRTTKKPLPIFIVELEPQANNKLIYNIKRLLNCNIHFEPPRPKREIPQCSNCQQYGHTKKYCRRNPKCIKCAGDHSSSTCAMKGRLSNVKCVLCEGNHPANYKGCYVYRELQKIKYPPLREKRLPKVLQKDETIPKPLSTSNMPKTTYARAVGSKEKSSDYNKIETNVAQEQNFVKDMMEMLKQMMNQLATMNNLLLALTNQISHSRSSK